MVTLTETLADHIERDRTTTHRHPQIVGLNPEDWDLIVSALRTADRIEALEAAAAKVCWFDWSDNDPDAVAAMDALRAALKD